MFGGLLLAVGDKFLLICKCGENFIFLQTAINYSVVMLKISERTQKLDSFYRFEVRNFNG